MADWCRDGTRIVVDHRSPGSRGLCLFESAGLGDLVAEPPRGKPDPNLVAGLVRQLGDDSFRIREAASRMLPEIGRPAVDPLRETLENPDSGQDLNLRARKLLDRIEAEPRFDGWTAMPGMPGVAYLAFGVDSCSRQTLFSSLV